MKICAMHANYPPVFSGAAIQFHRHAQYFVERGHDVLVITIQFLGTSPSEMMDGIKIVRLPILLNSKRNRKLSFMFLSAFELIKRRREYDLLHLHGFNKFYTLPVCIAKILGKKILYQITLLDAEPKIKQGFIYTVGLRYIDDVIALSTPLFQRAKKGPYPTRVSAVVPYGVDVNKYFPPTENEKLQIRDKFKLDPNGYYICFVGSTIKRKGGDILIRAFTSVYEHFPEATLLFIGEDGSSTLRMDPDKKLLYATDEIRALIESFALEERVIFTGLTDQVADYMQASDMFVFPSRKEGLGAVILEALATGLPCVVSELDGIAKDMITNGVDGYIVPGFDPEDYARMMMLVLSDDKKAKYIGHNARHTIENRFEISEIAKRYLRHYDCLLGE